MQFAKLISTKNSNNKLRKQPVVANQNDILSKRNAELEAAIRTVLRYISSNQVYDKDAKGILLRALESKIA